MSKWNAEWFTVPGAAVFDSSAQAASVSRAEDHLDLFLIGYDNHIWSTFWGADGGWSRDWFPVPGQAVFEKGRYITRPVIAAAIGDLAGSAFDALNNKVRSGLADESFTPIPITIVVDDPEHFARHPQVGRQLTQRVEQFGGVYEVLYEWHVS
ncbi:hypothetical protein [Streptomyces sp. NPDC054940]